MSLYQLVKGRHILRGRFIFCFVETKRVQGIILALAVLQGPLIQNNQYAEVACFGVACPRPHMGICGG